MAKKILIVDDEEGIRELLQELFAMEGFQVQTAGNGKEALVCLQKESFDWVITDVRMPEMDGIELAKEIRRTHPSMPKLVFITGYTEVTDFKTLELGDFKIFSKPFPPQNLINHLRQTMNREKKVKS